MAVLDFGALPGAFAEHRKQFKPDKPASKTAKPLVIIKSFEEAKERFDALKGRAKAEPEAFDDLLRDLEKHSGIRRFAVQCPGLKERPKAQHR